LTDSKALKLLQEGKQQALEWFIDRYSGYVATIVNSVLQGSMSQADVEEVTADVFVTLWKNSERLIPLNIKGECFFCRNIMFCAEVQQRAIS